MNGLLLSIAPCSARAQTVDSRAAGMSGNQTVCHLRPRAVLVYSRAVRCLIEHPLLAMEVRHPRSESPPDESDAQECLTLVRGGVGFMPGRNSSTSPGHNDQWCTTVATGERTACPSGVSATTSRSLRCRVAFMIAGEALNRRGRLWFESARRKIQQLAGLSGRVLRATTYRSDRRAYAASVPLRAYHQCRDRCPLTTLRCQESGARQSRAWVYHDARWAEV